MKKCLLLRVPQHHSKPLSIVTHCPLGPYFFPSKKKKLAQITRSLLLLADSAASLLFWLRNVSRTKTPLNGQFYSEQINLIFDQSSVVIAALTITYDRRLGESIPQNCTTLNRLWRFDKKRTLHDLR